MSPVLSTERIAHLGPGRRCCTTGFSVGRARRYQRSKQQFTRRVVRTGRRNFPVRDLIAGTAQVGEWAVKQNRRPSLRSLTPRDAVGHTSPWLMIQGSRTSGRCPAHEQQPQQAADPFAARVHKGMLQWAGPLYARGPAELSHNRPKTDHADAQRRPLVRFQGWRRRPHPPIRPVPAGGPWRSLSHDLARNWTSCRRQGSICDERGAVPNWNRAHELQEVGGEKSD